MFTSVASEPRLPQIIAAPSQGDELGDLRFRALLSSDDWASLPPAVRRRFSKRLSDGATSVYAGRVTHCEMTRAGRLLAEALRFVGAPLPLSREIGLPSIVTVTEEGASGGQNWTRVFARASGFPQIIHSTKRFCGPTGLEEYLGCGIRMALKLSVENGALVFTSTRYTVSIGTISVTLPRWLSPGMTRVTHRETGPGEFLFTLELTHALFGALVCQKALYREVETCPAASS